MRTALWGLVVLLSAHAGRSFAAEPPVAGGEPVKLALSIDDVRSLRSTPGGEVGLRLCPMAAKALEEFTRTNAGRLTETSIDGLLVLRVWAVGAIGSGSVGFRADTEAKLALVDRIAASVARRSVQQAPDGCAPGR